MFLATNFAFSQTSNVRGNGITITDGDSTPSTNDFTDFGSMDVVTGTVVRTFTIQNTGTANLTIGLFTIGGTNASNFTLTTPPVSPVIPGGSTTFQITFNPTANGFRLGTISFVNNDAAAGKNPYNFSIQGEGTTSEINVVGNGTSILDGNTIANTTDFTDFAGNATRLFTIQNSGTTPLLLGAITLSGTNAADYSIISPFANTNIPAGSNTTFTLLFTPGGAGTRTATVNIANNDGNENPYDFAIKGVATNNINLKGNGITIPDGDLTPIIADYTNFETTNIASPITRSFVIENLGNANLNLTGTPKVTITGTDFTISTQPTSPIPATGSRTFIVTFNPATIGIKTADISIANDDAGVGKNPYTFKITGEGVQKFIDTDSDGVFDHVDSDDDNDGIPDSIEQSFSSGNSVPATTKLVLLNETFGVGTTRGRINVNNSYATTTNCYEDGTTGQAADECDTTIDLNDGQYTVCNVAGTAAIASWAPTYWYQGVDHTPADTNGRMALFNATNNIQDEFYRTIVQGVIPNAPITYSFWILNLDRSDAPNIATRNRPNITVEFRDLSTNLMSSINTGDITPTVAGNLVGNWYQFTATFTPSTTGFSIIFKNNQLGGTGNDLAIDDISVLQTLTDADGDGAADVFDLDTDNDGIGDIIEDRWVSLGNGKDTMSLIPVSSGGTWIDANNNGWNDTAETYFNAGNSTKDFDGDGVPNYVDLDSDNDAIFDVDEAGIYNGDGDVNCDGAGEGTDLDKDGILSSFDTFNGFANGTKALPINTLGAINPDFINIVSKVLGVTDISNSLYASLDANNDGIIDGTTDADKDGIRDAFDTNTNYFGSPRDLNRKLLLDFDGRNDYGQNTAILGGLSNASLMAWIDWNNDTFAPFTAEGVIVGQDKFQIKLNSSKEIEVKVNTTTLTYSGVGKDLKPKRWYHVGATYGNGSLNLYLNGTLVKTQAVSGAIASDASLLTIGKNPLASDKYFKGKIDEVRVFNVTLTDDQFKRMVYQEIQNTSAQVRGAIIPKDIGTLGTLPFVNLLRYYRMDVYKDDIIDDLSTPAIDLLTGMKIYNNKNIYSQQAPMPFVTERIGDFKTAVNSVSREIVGQDITDQDCSIVLVKHNIIETVNTVDLGMIVDPSIKIIMNNDTKIQNDWYLKLDGIIDLQAESQLVQTTNSELDISSSGSIERDQKGQASKYNYNYWSSPVGALSTISNNNSFTVNGVMRDGSNPASIQNINWVSGYDGSATSPISLSNYWIFKFQNLTPLYSNWATVGPNGTLLAGQGYTMKGSNTEGTTQNYTFVGKPNNGIITSPIAANNANLSGNPYPSALDADAFITANASTIKGTLYFWEHFATNSSHNLIQYQGGYATRTIVGGTPPVSPSGISGLGSSARTPGRYIPVGQGFIVYGKSTAPVGSVITFDNAQRIFIKESNALSNILFRQTATGPVSIQNNHEDPIPSDNFAKIRIGFNAASGFHRQILLGFMNEYATSGYDDGYDASQIDDQPNEMSFAFGSENWVIQGDGDFSESKVYPLSVKTDATAEVNFTLDGIENFDTNHEIFIYDNVTETYHDIRSEAFHVTLPVGSVRDRFSLRFKDTSLLATNNNLTTDEGIKIIFTNVDHTINIANHVKGNTIKTVEVYNIVGQLIATWNLENQPSETIQLPLQQVSAGNYIVKITASNGTFSKKITIQ